MSTKLLNAGAKIHSDDSREALLSNATTSPNLATSLLFYAAKHDDLPMLEHILTNTKCDISARDKDGKSAMDYARQRDDKTCAQRLETQGIDTVAAPLASKLDQLATQMHGYVVQVEAKPGKSPDITTLGQHLVKETTDQPTQNTAVSVKSTHAPSRQ